MAGLFNVMGAAIIVGILFLSVFGLMGKLDEATYNKTFSLNVQTNAITLARMMESDLLKAGFHDTTKHAFISADSVSIKFRGDLQNVGVMHLDTVRYYLGSPTDPLAATTKNPRDRIIYHVVDNQATACNLGLTSLSFTYFNDGGFQTTSLDSIRSVRVKFTVESLEPVDTTYFSIYWDKTLYPKNLYARTGN